jgi:ubiquinone/menaquinone biosynthesis C-methylase UbiE
MLEIRHKIIHEGVSIQNAYDTLYQSVELQMRDSFYLWLLELLAPKPGDFLLDIACGQGRLVQLAAQQGIHATGLDLSFEGMYKGVRTAPQAHWIVADGKGIPLPDASVDAIMNIGSLEHYDEPVQGVREIARLLKPTGHACILLPNAYGLLGNILRVWQTGEIHDDHQPLQRYATRKTWEMMLKQGGLQIERLVPYGEIDLPRVTDDLRWLLERPHKFVRALIATLTPVNLANQFVFICKRAATPDQLAYYPMLPL